MSAKKLRVQGGARRKNVTRESVSNVGQTQSHVKNSKPTLSGEQMFSNARLTLLGSLQMGRVPKVGSAKAQLKAAKIVEQLKLHNYDEATSSMTIQPPPGESIKREVLDELEQVVLSKGYPIEAIVPVTAEDDDGDDPGFFDEVNAVSEGAKAQPEAESEAIGEVRLTPYSEINPQHLDYIWPGYLARNKLHHWAGNSVEGKSPVAIDLIACVTSPSQRPKWPDGTPNKNKPQSVLLLAGEDDRHDTVRPRLALAKANPNLVYDVQMTVNSDGKPMEKLLALDHDIDALIAKASKMKDLGLIVIDPISNYLGKVPMNREDRVREILMGLVKAAETLHFAIVTIGHFNRREKGTESLHRIMGAAAFGGVARFVYLFGPDPEDADQYAHVIVQRRGSGAPALRYKTIAESRKWHGESSKVIRVHWRGVSTATAESVVDPQNSEQKTQLKQAAQALQEFLERGPQHSKTCIAHLKDMGIDVVALNTSRVLRAAKVTSERLGDDKFYSWRLEHE